MSEFALRWMRLQDMDEIVEIEEQCFPYPWDKNDFDICLHKKDHVGIVATIDKKLVGYMIFCFNKKIYSVLSIAVDPKYQKKGCGTKMIDYIKTKVRSSSEGPKNQIHLIVSDQNLGCHNFLKSIGFVAIAVEKEYFGPFHDAYKFMLDMQEKPPEQKAKKTRKPRKIKDADRME